MKKITIVFAILATVLISNLVKAQDLPPIDPATKKITYVEVVDANGLTSADIYAALKQWGTDQGFTITEDKNNESITFDAKKEVEYTTVDGKGKEKGNVNFKVYLYAKEGKYRFIFTDYVHESLNAKTKAHGGKLENQQADCGATKMSARSWVFIKQATTVFSKEYIKSLKKKLLEVQNDPTKKTDW